MSQKKWIKDPQANVFYVFDFAQAFNNTGYSENYLFGNEELVQDSEFPVVTSDGSLQISDVQLLKSNTQVLFYASGGSDGVTYNVKCRIKTTLNQVDEITHQLIVKET